jgi:hypothetical protein
VQNLWKEVAPPKEWFLHESYLVPLGSGKFCIAQFFEIGRRSNFDYDERFAVFSGVEVEPCGMGGKDLRMVKINLHASSPLSWYSPSTETQ